MDHKPSEIKQTINTLGHDNDDTCEGTITIEQISDFLTASAHHKVHRTPDRSSELWNDDNVVRHLKLEDINQRRSETVTEARQDTEHARSLSVKSSAPGRHRTRVLSVMSTVLTIDHECREREASQNAYDPVVLV
uniref:EF-hand domain-containing protein n=1 Tax=Steinernema glaseri TaxID=37863 RepID=A0A1I7Y0K6_9BILA